jgi:hypothetical protein
MYRRTAPKVRGGKVQKKNNWEQSPNMFYTLQDEILVERKRAGKGFKHLIRKQEVYEFFELIPDWQKVSQGLDGVVLDGGSRSLLGRYNWSVITLFAWETEIVWNCATEKFVREHEEVFDMLNIPYSPSEDEKGYFRVGFTESSAKSFLLIHVFLHELGHHVDKMTSRQQESCGRGEDFAEGWARERAVEVYDNYCRFYRL